MPQDHDLMRLFQAFRENDSVAFRRAAESLIADAQASNHHNLARDLRRALGTTEAQPRRENGTPTLMTLPRDRRKGLSLLQVTESRVDATQVILGESAERRVARIIEEHRRMGQLQRLGYSPRRKILFWGPPGCGKTLVAHYLAHELGLPIGILKLSAIISSYLGDTAGNLQAVFDQARDQPMVLLLDEVDALGKSRDDKNDVGELKRVVNTLLQIIDSYSPTRGLLIAATNHQQLLDLALWRRFDDVIGFKKPSEKERQHYLQMRLGSTKYTGSLRQAARLTSYFSYADLRRIIDETIKTAILEDRSTVSLGDLRNSVEEYRMSLREAGLGGLVNGR